MSADFQKVLIKDDRLMVTDKVKYAVFKGGQNVTSAEFNAISQTNSSHTYNIQVPSEQTIIDRRVLWTSQVEFQVQGRPKQGEYLVNYAIDDAFAPFPLHQLATVMTATLNNNSVSINIKDTLPQMLRLLDPYELQAYNSTTPVMYDTYKYYADAKGTNNNPLAGWNNVAVDNQLVPRGAWRLDSITGNTAGDASGNLRTVTIKATFSEPLLLSPFLFADPQTNSQGVYGIQNMNFVFNIGDTKRFWRTAKNISDPSGVSYVADYAVSLLAFRNSKLQFNFLTPHPSDALVSPRNCVPYYELPRFLSTGASVIPAGAKGVTITSQSLQLNQIPDKLIICVRKQMGQQTWSDTDSFLAIKGISINFNNQSGILASASRDDLYRYSRDAGSNQHWLEYYGESTRADPSGGDGQATYTSGSLLVLNMGQAVQLTEDFYAPYFQEQGVKTSRNAMLVSCC